MLISTETNATPRHNKFSRLITGTTALFIVVAILAVGVAVFYGKDIANNTSPESNTKTADSELPEMLTAEELAAQRGEVYSPPEQTIFPEDTPPAVPSEL